MNHQETNVLIKACAMLWPTVPLQTEYGPEMLRLWQLALADVELLEAETVIVRLARAGDTFPPAPGVIARLALDDRARATGALAPDLDEAWQWVMTQVRLRGWYEGPPDSYLHPAVATAARTVGWGRLCHGDEAVTFAHFRNVYNVASTRLDAERRDGETMTVLGGQPSNTPELE